MAKRFSDTDKWKKPFIRGLQGAYKLLWFYILDDCDHAGIWHVDFEVAEIRIGEKINENEAIILFTDKIEIINGGTKWFIKDFIDFQYGELKETNRLHQSVINILQKHKVGAYKPLTRGQGYGQGNGEGIGQGQEKGQEQFNFENFDETFISAFDDITLESYSIAFKNIDLKAELQSFRVKCDNDKQKYYSRDVGGLRTAFQYHLRNARNNGKQTNKLETRVSEYDQYFASKSNK